MLNLCIQQGEMIEALEAQLSYLKSELAYLQLWDSASHIDFRCFEISNGPDSAPLGLYEA